MQVAKNEWDFGAAYKSCVSFSTDKFKRYSYIANNCIAFRDHLVEEMQHKGAEHKASLTGHWPRSELRKLAETTGVYYVMLPDKHLREDVLRRRRMFARTKVSTVVPSHPAESKS